MKIKINNAKKEKRGKKKKTLPGKKKPLKIKTRVREVMCKILPRKFYYSQAHESLFREWLVHPQGRYFKKLDRYLNFSQELV